MGLRRCLPSERSKYSVPDATIQDMRDAEVAKGLGIRSIPAVVIDGKLAACCAGRGVDEAVLRAAGLGRPA